MKANELRIGNITEHFMRGAIFMTAADILECSMYDHYTPIPLTEEWLLKFGFEKINHIHGYSFYISKRKKNSYLSRISVYDNRTTIGSDGIVNHCKYVHQLQNLYFALTGEELTTK